MKIVEIIKRMARNSDKVAVRSDEIVAGISNQSSLLNDKLIELIEGMANQSHLLSVKLEQLIEASRNQSSLLNDKLTAMIDRQNVQLELQKIEIAAVRQTLGSPETAGNDLPLIQAPPIPDSSVARAAAGKSPLEAALGQLPLLIAPKTYNTSHPGYEADLVRNFPGRIFNADRTCGNTVYADVRQLAQGGHVPDGAWNAVLKDALEEAKTVPHSNQVFERREYIENYLREITGKYQAHYAAGWVNLDDALFLYWLVRKLNPKVIVQTGVCNGLSAAFMVLGLVKNGSEGKLHAIDLPPVFNSQDPGWTVKGKVYGVVIPEGKSSGWIVPDAYRDRFEVWSGDAKELLPKMVDKIDSIDLFYHDSDHTYDHMMFEFREAKRKLRPGGLIVGDDVSWNSSVWDFADEYGVPSYNYKGAVGVGFF
jgi:predicted O-methyltransferase YrrM